MDKFEINVDYLSELTKFYINTNSNLDKLLKIVELYYDRLQDKQYNLYYGDTNLKDYNLQAKLCDIFNIENNTGYVVDSNISPVIDLIVEYSQELSKYYEVECNYNTHSKRFKISNELTFPNLKFKILASFKELEQENYQIIYLGNDITNYYGDNKILNEIFTDKSKDSIKIILKSKQKNIVEYHKRCSYCTFNKAISICNRCALYNCEDCFKKDTHDSNRNMNFVKLNDFIEYEQFTLENYLKILIENKIENENLNSQNYSNLVKDKVSVLEKKFNDIIDNITLLKNTQINNLKNIIDLVKNKYKPEGLDEIIKTLHEMVLKYKLNPFYDCEESMKKILELESSIKIFQSDFENYKINLNDFNNKFTSSVQIDNNINNYLKNSLIEANGIFKLSANKKNKFNPIMKIFDNKSVLVYDHFSEEFTLMNFIDLDNNFGNNFNNFVQVNYTSDTNSHLLFVITGSPCQNLFCYNYNTNEMEYIETLKFSHNWWPVLVVIPNMDKSGISKIDIFCLSGTYTSKCEKLMINFKEKKQDYKQEKDLIMEWKEIPSMNVAHGQASAFVSNGVNETTIFVLFGYDYNFNSIATVERLNIGDKKWEIINFKNPHAISSILYYHANLKFNENNVYILGGLKEINESDVVYNFEYGNLNLLKTEFKFELHNFKFCFEKNFVSLNKKDIVNIYNDNDIDENIDKKNTKFFDSLQDVKDFNSTIKMKNEKGNKEYLSDDTIFALFDSKNNVHSIKPNKFEYRTKYFELKK